MNLERLSYICGVLTMAVLGVRCGTEDEGAKHSHIKAISANCHKADGVPGTRARFEIDGSNLYVIGGGETDVGYVRPDFDRAQIFDITDPGDPKATGSVTFGVDVETLIIQDSELFVGSCKGLEIYDNADRTSPKLVSTITAALGCHPTVVRGSTVFVSVQRSDNDRCEASTSQVTVYDISDASAPKPLAAHPMQAPGQLAIDGDTLFLCDGDAGLKVLNAGDPVSLPVLEQREGTKCTSVFTDGSKLVATDAAGVAQLSYSTLPLTEASFLAFAP